MVGLPGIKERISDAVKEFVARRQWEIDVARNDSARCESACVAIDVNENTGFLIIDIYEDVKILDTFIYYSILCPESLRGQMCLLLNEMHSRNAFGRFELMQDGKIRWRNRSLCEGVSLTSDMIEAIFQPAHAVVERFDGVIRRAAAYRCIVADALEEYDLGND